MSYEHRMTRRQAVKAAGATGAGWVFAPVVGGLWTPPALGATASASAAKLTPELTEGPYWVNTMLRRANLLANGHEGGHRQAYSSSSTSTSVTPVLIGR